MKMLCPPAGAFLPRRPWAFDHDHAFPTRRSSDLVALAVAPRVMNGAALTVLTGSMEPTYSPGDMVRSEEHTSELQSRGHLVCRLLREKNKTLGRTLIQREQLATERNYEKKTGNAP